MPINNLGGIQNIGVQQSNEAGSTTTSSPTFQWGSIGGRGSFTNSGTGGIWIGDSWTGGNEPRDFRTETHRSSDSGEWGSGGNGSIGDPYSSNSGGLPAASVGSTGIIDDSTWQAAHASIQPGLYFIKNRAKESLLVLYHFAQNPRAVIQAFPYHRDQNGPERRWEIRRGGANPTDLCIVSHFRSERYLTDGPHVFEERNTVRLIPVPQSRDWFYLSPNMNNPTTIILDPNAKGSVGPVTTVQLRDINGDIRDAQWQLIPSLN